MAHPKHSDPSASPALNHGSRSKRYFNGHKRLTVAEVAAVVLMHAPGKMLRTSEIAAGAKKMFVPRYDDPKALSRFRSSLRHELSKFRDGKFYRVPKEHGRAGRGDLWAYIGDGDPRTRALIDRIIEERGHAKDYSKRHHTFEVMVQNPVSESPPPKGANLPTDHLPTTPTKTILPQSCPLITYAPTPILHPSVQPRPLFASHSLRLEHETPSIHAFSPTSSTSETFDEASVTAARSTVMPAFKDAPIASQEPELFDFSFSLPPTSQSPLLENLDLSYNQSQCLWNLYGIYFGEQSFRSF